MDPQQNSGFFRMPDDMQLTIMGSCPYADTLASLMQGCKKINIFKDNLTTRRDYGLLEFKEGGVVSQLLNLRPLGYHLVPNNPVLNFLWRDFWMKQTIS